MENILANVENIMVNVESNVINIEMNMMVNVGINSIHTGSRTVKDVI